MRRAEQGYSLDGASAALEADRREGSQFMKREADRNRGKKRVANVGGLRKTKAERSRWTGEGEGR